MDKIPPMPASATNDVIENVLSAVGGCLDAASAEALLRLRAPDQLQARIEDLADRCTEGRLSDEEREEYESLVRLKFHRHPADPRTSATRPCGLMDPAKRAFVRRGHGADDGADVLFQFVCEDFRHEIGS